MLVHPVKHDKNQERGKVARKDFHPVRSGIFFAAVYPAELAGKKNHTENYQY